MQRIFLFVTLFFFLLFLSQFSPVKAQTVNSAGNVVYSGSSATPTPTPTSGITAPNSTPTTFEFINGTTFTLPAGYFPDFKTLMTWLLQVALVVSVLLVLFQLVYAGVNWITSGGDKGKTDNARSRIVAAIIGLVIVVASWAVFLFILQLIGISPSSVLPSLT